MSAPPSFASLADYRARLGDVGFWEPYLEEILDRHGLKGSRLAGRPVPGFNPTWPTFVWGDLVLKLFGGLPPWRGSHAIERDAHTLVATDPEIVAPGLLAEGALFDVADATWPYLVTTRVSGVAWRDARLSRAERLSVAAELGAQIRRVHALAPSGVRRLGEGPSLDVAAAAERSSLPAHLVAQVDDYLARLGPWDPVFVHGDLVAAHAFVESGRLTGIIDWGDAMVCDRHYEIIQIHRDCFACDQALLRAFLEACAWPADEAFPRRALGHALHRQAVGLVQHHSMDVFEPVAALLPLDEIATLEELATRLFDAG